MQPTILFLVLVYGGCALLVVPLVYVVVVFANAGWYGLLAGLLMFAAFWFGVEFGIIPGLISKWITARVNSNPERYGTLRQLFFRDTGDGRHQ